MKKTLLFLSIIFIISTVISIDTFAIKGRKVWQLYDNFESGFINPNLWICSGPTGTTFSVENGMAKITYPVNPTALSAWLRIKDEDLVNKIRGIKAKIYIESSNGDFRARIAPNIKIDTYYLFPQLAFEPTIQIPRVFGSLSLLGPPTDFIYQYDLFYGQFTRPGPPYWKPLQLKGQTFDVTMIFTSDKVIYEVEGFGEIEHKLPEKLDPFNLVFIGLGARGTNSGVVYFDDVYILLEE